MVKGVNRQIIEVKNPDGEYFDRALLFLKAGSQVPPADKLPQLAREYVNAADMGVSSGTAETGEQDNPESAALPEFVSEYAKKAHRLRLAVRLLAAAFVALSVFCAALLIVYTKML